MVVLKKCPFCGSERVKVVVKKCRRYHTGVRTNGFASFIRCNVCLARGPYVGDTMFRTEDGKEVERKTVINAAKENWNERYDRLEHR